MNEMRLTTVQCGGDESTFEAYTDGSTWNGWLNVWFTREQLAAWINESPYDYKFCEAHTPLNNKEYPIVILYFEDEDIIDSSPLRLVIPKTHEVEILESYCMNGYCFYEVAS